MCWQFKKEVPTCLCVKLADDFIFNLFELQSLLRKEEVDDSEHFTCQVDGQFDLTLSSQR